MEFEASVSYGFGNARYRINKENPGIYSASLIIFDGDSAKYPPKEIILLRGIRSWTGSNNDEKLINTLGGLIEEYISKQGGENNPL